MKTKVRNMDTPSGRTAPNQFIIETAGTTYFQSYASVIAKKENGKVTLDPKYWDYSVTTLRYLKQFLGTNKKETQSRIDSGEYSLASLN